MISNVIGEYYHFVDYFSFVILRNGDVYREEPANPRVDNKLSIWKVSYGLVF